MIYTCYIAECASCDAPSTKRQCSCGDDLLTLSEYHINKDLTGVQGQATVKVRTHNAFCTIRVYT